MNPAPPLIEIQNASVMRGDRIVLHDLSLRVGLGEHIAILGPNGCGKSTLIKTLTRECYPLARPNTVMRLFGQETWNVFDLRPLLGIVATGYQSTCRPLSAREVVLSGFFSSVGIWPHHVVTAEMERSAEKAIAQLEAGHLADRIYDELSSGEARRILIARALVHAPKALLFDEPSTSLDLFAQHELRDTMRSLARQGIALLLVTHHLGDIIPEVERVIFMKNGRIVADGPRERLLARAPIENLFGVNVDLSMRDGYVHAW